MEEREVQGNVFIHDGLLGFRNIIIRWFALNWIIGKIGHCFLLTHVLGIDCARHDLIKHCNEGIKEHQHPADSRDIENEMGSCRSFGVDVGANRSKPSRNGCTDVFSHYDGRGDFKINPPVDRNDDGYTHRRRGRLDEDCKKNPYDKKNKDRAESEAVEVLDYALDVLHKSDVSRVIACQ